MNLHAFDPGKLEQLIGDSPVDQRCVLERLLGELHEAVPAMEAALRAQQWDVLRGYAHKYRGTSSVVGAAACADILGRLEQCLLMQQAGAAPELVDCLAKAVADFGIAVHEHLQADVQAPGTPTPPSSQMMSEDHAAGRSSH